MSLRGMDDSDPAFPPHTGHPPKPYMEPENRVAGSIVCSHKGQQLLSAPDVALWPRLQLYPVPHCHAPSPELGLLTKPIGRISLEQGPQEALGFRAQKLGHA